MDSKTVEAVLREFYSLVDYTKPSFQLSVLAIAFNPTAWNIVARNGKCFRDLVTMLFLSDAAVLLYLSFSFCYASRFRETKS